MVMGKFKKAAKKAAKSAGRATVGKAAKQMRRGARAVGEATPGYGSYAKTIKKLTREGKTK